MESETLFACTDETILEEEAKTKQHWDFHNFPLGKARSYCCWRMVLGFCLMGITMTSCFAYTVLLAATSMSQDTQPTPSEVAEYLAGKPISYWLIALAVFTGASFTAIVKWLLSQLQDQRSVNANSSKELLGYLRDDRMALATELANVASVVSENTKALQEFRSHLSTHK